MPFNHSIGITNSTFIIVYVFVSKFGVPKQFLIFGESGGASCLYQLAERFGLCNLAAERDCISFASCTSQYRPSLTRPGSFSTVSPPYKGDDVRTKERSLSVKKSSAHIMHSTCCYSHSPALSPPATSPLQSASPQS